MNKRVYWTVLKRNKSLYIPYYIEGYLPSRPTEVVLFKRKKDALAYINYCDLQQCDVKKVTLIV